MKGKAGLYVHFPFCRSKCPYCDFVSGPAGNEVKEKYVEALKRELRYWSGRPEVKELVFGSLYLGGGTPTVMRPGAVSEVVSEALGLFEWCRDPEITMEANPESTTPEGLGIVKEAGVNRISIGFQSMSARGLKVLGRLHDVDTAVEAFEAARLVGFGSISMDLIYGWPGQEAEGWQQELYSALELGPDHVSCYELTLEPGTKLYDEFCKGVVCLPDEETVLQMMDITEDSLKEQGYVHYEISNFALPGRLCRHNLGYWSSMTYLGIGASAASCLPPVRMKQCEDVQEYMKRVEEGIFAPEFREVLTREQAFREAVVFGLRKVAGIDLAIFEQEWGYDPIGYYGERAKRLMDSGLVKIEEAGGARMLRLTRQGRRISNLVFTELV